MSSANFFMTSALISMLEPAPIAVQPSAFLRPLNLLASLFFFFLFLFTLSRPEIVSHSVYCKGSSLKFEGLMTRRTLSAENGRKVRDRRNRKQLHSLGSFCRLLKRASWNDEGFKAQFLSFLDSSFWLGNSTHLAG